jgi:hypothetical protein
MPQKTEHAQKFTEISTASPTDFHLQSALPVVGGFSVCLILVTVQILIQHRSFLTNFQRLLFLLCWLSLPLLTYYLLEIYVQRNYSILPITIERSTV